MLAEPGGYLLKLRPSSNHHSPRTQILGYELPNPGDYHSTAALGFFHGTLRIIGPTSPTPTVAGGSTWGEPPGLNQLRMG
jgi:hypothetical protein